MTLHHKLMTRLRHFCHSDPTPRAWKGICSLLSRLEHEDDFSVALDYTLHNLTHWPHSLRLAPPYWWERMNLGDLPAPWPLVHYLDAPLFSAKALNLLLNNKSAPLLRSLYLRNPDGDVDIQQLCAQLRRSPLRENLTRLTLNIIDLTNHSIQDLLSETWPALERLDLRHSLQLTDDLLPHINAERLPNLRELCLLSMPRINVQSLVKQLTEHGPVGLHTLEITDAALSDETLMTLVNATRINLQTLSCQQNGLSDEAQAHCLRLQPRASQRHLILRSSDARRLSKQLNLLDLDVLEDLRIYGTHDGDACLRQLASRELPRLEGLHLPGLQITPRGIDELTSADWFPRLRTLDLSQNPIGHQGLLTLLKAQHPPKLEHLGLATCDIGPEAVAPLLDAASLSGLQRLDLNHNPIEGAAMQTLLERNTVPCLGVNLYGLAPELRTLALSNLPVMRHTLRLYPSPTPQAFAAIFDHWNLSDDDGAALVRTLHSLPFTQLSLRHNNISIKTAEALADAPNWKIRLLTLSQNTLLDAACIETLGRAAFVNDLAALGLAQCDLDDEALIAISRWPRVPADLWLEGNAFSQPGFDALLEAPWVGKGLRLRLNGPGEAIAALRARGVTVYPY